MTTNRLRCLLLTATLLLLGTTTFAQTATTSVMLGSIDRVRETYRSITAFVPADTVDPVVILINVPDEADYDDTRNWVCIESFRQVDGVWIPTGPDGSGQGICFHGGHRVTRLGVVDPPTFMQLDPAMVAGLNIRIDMEVRRPLRAGINVRITSPN